MGLVAVLLLGAADASSSGRQVPPNVKEGVILIAAVPFLAAPGALEAGTVREVQGHWLRVWVEVDDKDFPEGLELGVNLNAIGWVAVIEPKPAAQGGQ